MSVLLPSVRSRVLVNLRSDDSRTGPGDVEVDQCIRDTYMLMQSRLPPARVQVTSAFTISAGADTFSLAVAATEEYAGEFEIQLQSTRDFLDKVDQVEINRLRAGQDSTHQGVPRYFAVWEDTSQVVQGRCYPRSRDAEVCDLFRSVLSADFDLTAVDSTAIAFSRYGILALILGTSARLLSKMDAEELKLRRLNPNVGKQWNAEAETVLYKEACRRHDIESTGRTKRLVS